MDDNDIHGKGKKKMTHRKPKGKKNVDKEIDNSKSKSVEPIVTDDNISIDLNFNSNNENSQQDEKEDSNKTNKIQKEVDEKWALWKKRNNAACDTIDRNRFNKKKKLCRC